ncbi:MAG: polymer-forming cytoskeletal protein [Leptonema sp. (in: bacteria)]
MAESLETLPINSLIGEGSEFRGEFKIKDLLRIDGYFKGTIQTEGKILISKTGKVESDLRAGIVVVGGEIIGNILAKKRVVLLSTSKVKGDIISPSLILEEGCQFEGRCTINKEPL